MKNSALAALGELVGQQVRVTVTRFPDDPKAPDRDIYVGRLMAIGRKVGRYHSRPYCLVLDASERGEGIPIIAARSVVAVEPTTDSQTT